MKLRDFQKIVDHFPAVSRRVRDSVLWNALQRRKLRSWETSGRPIPPPDVYKRVTVLEYARRFKLRTLVETGTFYGGMLLAMRHHFDWLYSIELDPWLHNRAKRMFARNKHIHLKFGDSARELEPVLDTLDEPALFWLDAHYSGRGTAKADLETPISAELDLILDHPLRNHVVLIDDAHDFGRLPDYPTVDEVRRAVVTRRSDLVVENRDGIIRIHPGTEAHARLMRGLDRSSDASESRISASMA